MQKDSLATNAILWAFFYYFVLLVCRSLTQDLLKIERDLDIIYSISLIYTHGKIGASKVLIHWKST